MRSPKQAKAKTHEQVMKDRGLRVADLMVATGLSDEGIRKCLRANRPPRNPLVARAYLSALGLGDAAAVKP